MTETVGERIQRVLDGIGMTQRGLAVESGLSQSTLSRIISGDRPAKTPELVVIATVTGATVAELVGTPSIAEKAQFAARAENCASMGAMYQQLLRFLALEEYLADHGIDAA
ncbi:helix-turn-helix domain-containing protein [Nocardia takedensis]